MPWCAGESLYKVQVKILPIACLTVGEKTGYPVNVVASDTIVFHLL